MTQDLPEFRGTRSPNGMVVVVEEAGGQDFPEFRGTSTPIRGHTYSNKYSSCVLGGHKASQNLGALGLKLGKQGEEAQYLEELRGTSHSLRGHITS